MLGPDTINAPVAEVRAMRAIQPATLLVSDGVGDQIVRIDLTGAVPPEVLVAGGPGGVSGPTDMLVKGSDLLVITHGTQVRRFDLASGDFMEVLIEDSGIIGATALALLPDGDLAVASPERHVVNTYDVVTGFPHGSFTDEYAVVEPTDIVPINADHFLIPKANESYARLVEYSADGRYIRSLVRGDLELTNPQALAVRGANPLDCNGNAIPDACELDQGDANDNGILDACECMSDLSGDGLVGADDLLAIIAAWGSQGGPEDLDGSGTVDAGDVLAILDQWGNC